MDELAIDDPVFDGCVDLVAAVFKRARRDVVSSKVSQFDKFTAREFLDDPKAIEFGLAFTGHRRRWGFDL